MWTEDVSVLHQLRKSHKKHLALVDAQAKTSQTGQVRCQLIVHNILI